MLQTSLCRKLHFTSVERDSLNAFAFTLEVCVSGPLQADGVIIDVGTLDQILRHLVLPFKDQSYQGDLMAFASRLHEAFATQLKQHPGLVLRKLTLSQGEDIAIQIEV